MALGTLELLNGANGHSRPTSVVEPKAPMAAVVEHGLGADLDACRLLQSVCLHCSPNIKCRRKK